MKDFIKIQYFGIEYVKKIHDEQVLQFGKNGLMGIKDQGQLESILCNIQNDEYYPTFIDKLTHLIFCLVKFHIFNDGNKRTAIACSSYFLQINRIRLYSRKIYTRNGKCLYMVS